MAEYKTTITAYTLSSDLFFEQFYLFKCPKCGSRLKAATSDAGKDDFCPVCRIEFIAPGGIVVDPGQVLEPENELDDATVVSLIEGEGLHKQQDSLRSQAPIFDQRLHTNRDLLPEDSGADMFRDPFVASLQPDAINTDKTFSEEASSVESNSKSGLKNFRITGVDGYSGMVRNFEVFAENERSAHKHAKELNVFPTSIDALPEDIEEAVGSAVISKAPPKTAPSIPEKRSDHFGTDPDTDTEVYCPECQKLISIRARKCPYCRSAVNENRTTALLIRIMIVIAILLWVLGYYLNKNANEEIDKLRRNNRY